MSQPVVHQTRTGVQYPKIKKVRSKTPWVIFAVVAVITILFYFAPMAYLLGVSLQSTHQFLSNPVTFPNPIKLSNFVDAWKQASMGEYFSNSIIYTFFSTVISLILGIFLAFPVSRKYVRGSKILYIAFISGIFLPIGLIPLFIESRILDLYNNRIGYILLHLQGGLNFGFFIFSGYFKTIPVELDESAVIDGCGYIRYIWSIILPLVKPAIATVGIYVAIGVWNDLIGPVVFLAKNSLFPLTRGLYTFYGNYQSEWTLLAAGVFIVAAPLIVAFIFLQRYLVEGAVAGAVKM